MATKTAKPKKAQVKSASLDDLFNEVDEVTEVQTVASTPKKDRPTMSLPEDLTAKFVKLVRYSQVAKRIEQVYRNVKSDVETGLMVAWCEFVSGAKSRPKNNPKVELRDGETTYKGLFQVHARFIKIQPTIDENQSPEDAICTMMTNLGIAEETAIEIVKNELNCTPARGIHPFDKVMTEEGGPEALQRLMAFAMAKPDDKNLVHVAPLTAADRKLLFFRLARVEVKEGFLDRVALYTKTPAQLKAVLTVVKPVAYPSHMKIVCGGSVEEQAEHEYEILKGVSAEMLGVASEDTKEEESSND